MDLQVLETDQLSWVETACKFLIATISCEEVAADVPIEEIRGVILGTCAAARRLRGAKDCPESLLVLVGRFAERLSFAATNAAASSAMDGPGSAPAHPIVEDENDLEMKAALAATSLLTEAFAERNDAGKFPALASLAAILVAGFGESPAIVQRLKPLLPSLRTVLSSKIGPTERQSALIVLSEPMVSSGFGWVFEGISETSKSPEFARLLAGLMRVEIAVELEREPHDRRDATVIASFRMVEALLMDLVEEKSPWLLSIGIAALGLILNTLSDIFRTLLCFVIEKVYIYIYIFVALH